MSTITKYTKSSISKLPKFPSFSVTKATPATTPENNDLLVSVKKNNRAARAARIWVQFFDVVCQTTT